MKIVIISSHAPSLVYFRGGLIRALCQKGAQVIALAPNFNDETRAAVCALGGQAIDCAISRAGMNPFTDCLDAFNLSKQLRKLGPDIALCYFVKPVIFGTLAAWWAGVPRRLAMIEGLGFVFTPSGYDFSFKRKLLKIVVSFLYLLALKKAEKVFFLNPDDLFDFVSTRLVSKDKVSCLGGIGVDLDFWSVVPLPIKPITFLLVARLLREKGIVEYAEASRVVKRRYPGARFILLGGLDENPGSISESDVRDWMEQGLLEWYGHVPVKPWIAQSSVYVLPSYREGVPVSTQEAMAMGRPVITTDAPGCRETVVDGLNGFLVPIRDIDTLALKMIFFIENPHLVSVMGAESRRIAESKFDVNMANDKLINAMIG